MTTPRFASASFPTPLMLPTPAPSQHYLAPTPLTAPSQLLPSPSCCGCGAGSRHLLPSIGNCGCGRGRDGTQWASLRPLWQSSAASPFPFPCSGCLLAGLSGSARCWCLSQSCPCLSHTQPNFPPWLKHGGGVGGGGGT